MIFNLCGRHESDLNFSVTVSASAPTQGVSPGTIWVKSDTACTYIQMIDDATKWSSPPDGAVAIICAAANTSNAWMTAIKSHPMYVRTLGCYQRIAGAWASMDAYMWSNAGSWAQFSYAFYATISVTWPAGSTCAISCGDTRLVAPDTSGSYTFVVSNAGTWAVSCTDGTNIASGSVSIAASGESKSVTLQYFISTISVTYPSGSTCTAKCGGTTLTAPDTSGSATFTVRFAGDWVITSTGGGLSASQTVSITASGQSKSVTLQYFTSTIAVTWPSGSTCTAKCGSTTLTAPNTSGSYTFTVHAAGSWVISCSGGGNSATATVSITATGQSKSVALTYNKIPAFSYTGQYKIVNDSGTEISETTTNNWNIRLLTSGTLTFTNLRGTSSIDVFLVGGGGGSPSKTTSTDYGTVHCGGGGGGYTKTQKGVSVSANAGITVRIGAGGGAGSSGGSSTVAINGSTYSASGGGAGGASWWNGSNTVCGSGGFGGSGGGAASSGGFTGGSGGSDGGNGSGGRSNVFPTGSAGSGQGTTTRAFGESSGELYSYGGSGGGGSVPVVGTLAANTGHGGQGSGGGGYSGIVIIRGHR